MAPNPYESVRILPASSAFASLSKDEVQRAFFRTVTKTEFEDASNACLPEKGLLQDAKGENMREVHQIRDRGSKYLQFQYKRAPLWTRNSCEQFREFHQHPLFDREITTALAIENKQKSKGAGRSDKHAKFDHQTKYTDDFKQMTSEETRGARPRSARPYKLLTAAGREAHPLRGTEETMEKMTHEHDNFRPHPLDLAKAERAPPPKSNLGVGAPNFIPPTTAYRDLFEKAPYVGATKGVPRRPGALVASKKPSRCYSAPSRRREVPMPEQSAASRKLSRCHSAPSRRQEVAVPERESDSTVSAVAPSAVFSQAPSNCPAPVGVACKRPTSAVGTRPASGRRRSAPGAKHVQRPQSATAIR